MGRRISPVMATMFCGVLVCSASCTSLFSDADQNALEVDASTEIDAAVADARAEDASLLPDAQLAVPDATPPVEFNFTFTLTCVAGCSWSFSSTGEAGGGGGGGPIVFPVTVAEGDELTITANCFDAQAVSWAPQGLCTDEVAQCVLIAAASDPAVTAACKGE